MPATLDLLEAKRHETFSALLEPENDRLTFDTKVARLEGQLRALYRLAIQESKRDVSVREIFELWNKMVSICDFFIDYLHDISTHFSRPVSYDNLLDLRLQCDDKREFHRC